jgi:hypothetical protein
MIQEKDKLSENLNKSEIEKNDMQSEINSLKKKN